MDVDTDDNAADFVVLEMPTPARRRSAVPEPASASLLAGPPCWQQRTRRRRRLAL
jgi:hypothetical protein